MSYQDYDDDSKYEDGGSSEIEPVASTVVILGAIACGTGGLALQIIALGYQTGSFFQYGTYILRVFNQQDFVGLVLQVAIFLGLLIVIASIATGAAALTKRRSLVAFNLFVLVVLSLCMAGLGGAILFLSSEIDTTIQSTGSSEDGSFSAQVSDYLAALYTECCEVANFLEGDSDILTECLPSGPPSETETCYRDDALYTEYRRTANAWVCGELAQGLVNLDGVLIPNTNFEATVLTGGVSIVPVVGEAGAPVYGCGTGRALAFQYAFYVWFDQAVGPIAVTSLVCGILQLLILFCGCASVCIGNVDDEFNGLSMFQETNPYNQPTFDPEKERQARQIQAYQRQQQLAEQQQAALEHHQAALKQEQQAGTVIARLVPRDVDDKI